MKVAGSTDSPGRRGSAPDRSRCGGGAWPCLCFDPPGQTEADENWTEGQGQSDAEDRRRGLRCGVSRTRQVCSGVRSHSDYGIGSHLNWPDAMLSPVKRLFLASRRFSRSFLSNFCQRKGHSYILTRCSWTSTEPTSAANLTHPFNKETLNVLQRGKFHQQSN